MALHIPDPLDINMTRKSSSPLYVAPGNATKVTPQSVTTPRMGAVHQTAGTIGNADYKTMGDAREGRSGSSRGATAFSGMEHFLNSRINSAGGRRMSGSDGKSGYVYTDGPYRGMTIDQALEKATTEWKSMGQAGWDAYDRENNPANMRANTSGGPQIPRANMSPPSRYSANFAGLGNMPSPTSSVATNVGTSVVAGNPADAAKLLVENKAGVFTQPNGVRTTVGGGVIVPTIGAPNNGGVAKTLTSPYGSGSVTFGPKPPTAAQLAEASNFQAVQQAPQATSIPKQPSPPPAAPAAPAAANATPKFGDYSAWQAETAAKNTALNQKQQASGAPPSPEMLAAAGKVAQSTAAGAIRPAMPEWNALDGRQSHTVSSVAGRGPGTLEGALTFLNPQQILQGNNSEIASVLPKSLIPKVPPIYSNPAARAMGDTEAVLKLEEAGRLRRTAGDANGNNRRIEFTTTPDLAPKPPGPANFFKGVQSTVARVASDVLKNQGPKPPVR